jgi:hypothetical protein
MEKKRRTPKGERERERERESKKKRNKKRKMTYLKLPEQRIATSVGTDTGGRAPNPNRQHFPTDLSLSN